MINLSRFPQPIGRVLFWLTWPGIWLTIKFTPPRTRVVVIHKGKVLLTQDWLGNGSWSLPGGGLHRGEDAPDGAVRELLEETGVTVLPEQLRSIGSFKVRSSGVVVDLRAFWVKLSKEPTLVLRASEIADCRWFNAEELEATKLSNSAGVILAALKSTQNLLK